MNSAHAQNIGTACTNLALDVNVHSSIRQQSLHCSSATIEAGIHECSPSTLQHIKLSASYDKRTMSIIPPCPAAASPIDNTTKAYTNSNSSINNMVQPLSNNHGIARGLTLSCRLTSTLASTSRACTMAEWPLQLVHMRAVNPSYSIPSPSADDRRSTMQTCSTTATIIHHTISTAAQTPLYRTATSWHSHLFTTIMM